MNHRSTNAAACFLVASFLAGLTSSANAQTKHTLNALAELHERIVRPSERLMPQAARDADDAVISWRLENVKLDTEPARQLCELQVMFALAAGDARTALERAAELDKLAPEQRVTLELTYLASLVAADADAAEEALKQLARLVKADERRELSQKRRRVRGVGEQAPDVEIRTDEHGDIAVRRRGDDVLVVDFWNLDSPPSAELCATLVAAHKEFERERHLEFVGVSADPEDQLDASRAFAKKSGFDWPQRYEGVERDAPITHVAFRAGNPPWTVIVDSYGDVRFVGGADEPAFYYVLAAALGEADGKFKRVGSHHGDGGDDAASGGGEKEKPKPPPPSNVAPPESDPDALNKFNAARLALRTGSRQKAKTLFEEVVRRWPDSLEAQKAAEILETL